MNTKRGKDFINDIPTHIKTEQTQMGQLKGTALELGDIIAPLDHLMPKLLR